MAESDSEECGVAGPIKPEPECVPADSGVGNGHSTTTSLVKKETDLGSVHMGNLIKTESQDGVDLGFMICMNPDQIKTEPEDKDYIKLEENNISSNLSESSSNQMKCESSEYSVNSQLNSVTNESGTECEAKTEPFKYEGDLNQCFKNDMKLNPIEAQQCCDLKKHGKPYKASNAGSFISDSQISAVSRKVRTPIVHSDENVYGVKTYKCSQCEKCFGRASTLNQHKRTHADEKRLECIKCRKRFSRISALKRHETIHSGGKPHGCTHCGKYFNKASALNQHVRIHSGEKSCVCPQCGKCFSNVSNLKAHQKTHTGEKPFECVQCGKFFNRVWNLKHHLRIHSGEKPIQCVQCGKCFSQLSTLKHHQRIHSGEKPFECIECGHRFRHPSHLNQHMRIHSGEKPYRCAHCGKCFPQSSSVKRHEKIHLGEKPYKCTQCGRCFGQTAHLKQHRRLHSGGKNI